MLYNRSLLISMEMDVDSVDSDDSKDDEKHQHDDGDGDGEHDEESLPMYPPELVGTQSDAMLMVIMLNVCAVSSVFAKDNHDRHISKKSILYGTYCDLAERGCLIGRSEEAVELVRKCVLHLLTFPMVREKWIGIRLRTQTIIPKSRRSWTPNENELETRRDSVIILGPPYESCPHCNSNLRTKNRMAHQDCFTLDGVVGLSALSYICNSCSGGDNGTVVFHYDFYLWRGQKHFYDGSVGGENRSRVYSQSLRKSVSLPDYVRVGARWFSWEYMKGVSVQTILGRNSYGKTAELFAQTTHQRNLVNATVEHRITNDLRDRWLMVAHLWWRLLQVYLLSLKVHVTFPHI